MRLVDLSAPIDGQPAGARRRLRTDVEFARPRRGRARRSRRCSGVPARLLRDGEGWAVESSRASAPTTRPTSTRPGTTTRRSAASRAQTIDELPLEWFHAPGVVLDMTAKADGEAMTAAEAQAASAAASATTSQPRDIVLVRTGRDEFYGEPDYIAPRAGRHRRGDALAVRPGRAGHGHRRLGLGRAAAPPGRGGQASATSPGSSGPPTRPTCPTRQIERLVNLAALPPTGLHRVACFPLRIVGGSAAPARVVAILDD